MERIIIGRAGAPNIQPNSVTMNLALFNPFQNMKLALIKWKIFFYAPVMSNPRLEGLHEIFKDYKQIVHIETEGDNTFAHISLVCQTSDVKTLPVNEYILLGALKFDRVPNAKPVSWGMNEGFVSELKMINSQMTL